MRIVCPKCVAQYEVDDSAIPESGREVQCANCNHIWFQDRIEMLPTRPKETEPEKPEIFADLEGVGDTQFHSARAEPELEEEPDDEDLPNILADIDEAEDDGVDAEVALPEEEEPEAELDADAAFARARDELDKAAAAALDGGFGPGEDEPARSEEAEALSEAAGPEPEEILPEPEGDPLADLEAFRAEFDPAEAEEVRVEALVEEVEAPPYEPMVPPDDPVEALRETEDEDDEEFEEAPRERRAWRADGAYSVEDLASVDEFELADRLASELADGEDEPREQEDIRDAWFGGVDDEADDADLDGEEEAEAEAAEPEGDEVDALMARIAAASGADEAEADEREGTGQAPELELEPASEPEASGAVLPPEVAALGLRRPKARGVRSRPDPAARLSRPSRPNRDVDAEKTPRPERRAKLPDIDAVSERLVPPPPDPSELERNPLRNASLAAMPEETEGEASGAFRRAFIWTLFFVALLMALYVFRPQIVALVPAAAIVLDPYAGLVDQLRVQIDQFIAGLMGG